MFQLIKVHKGKYLYLFEDKCLYKKTSGVYFKCWENDCNVGITLKQEVVSYVKSRKVHSHKENHESEAIRLKMEEGLKDAAKNTPETIEQIYSKALLG